MLSHRKGVLLDGIGSELVRSANGGRRKTLSAWLASIADEVAQTFTSGDATPSVLNGAQFITAGATAITDFDDAVEGQVIFIYRGSADIVITRNASLIETLTAASITLTATHPMASFRSVSGVWQEVERSDTAIAAAGSTAARTLAARFGDMLSPEDFGAVGDGATNDLTPLTNWLNAVMASSSRCGYMPAKTYAISGALPDITVSGVQIFGSGPSSSHDIGSGPSGTILKAITNSGFTMMTVAPTEGASAQRLDSVRIIGVSFNCNSLAAKGLLVKSVFRGEFDVYAQEATTSGLELDVATTLGEAKDCQRNIIRFIGRQYSNTAPGLRLKGSTTANISFNQFEYVDVGHYNGTGIICENADNNVWHDLRVIKAAGGSATDSIEWRGGATTAERVRAEYVYQLSTTVRAVAKGTGTYTVGAGPIYVDCLDTENGSAIPSAEVGASIFVGGRVKGTDAPSASTTDLARYGAEYTEITGTTGISALGTVRAGEIRWVRFTGALLLTHNGTSLILPGGANITTVANDTACFVSLGSGNWLCLDYKTQTRTGTGGLVHATSPTLVTPVLGAASATSIAFTSTTGVVGTTTNDSAAAGSVGEYVESVIAIGSAVALTTATPANVTSISLTAGDWDVWVDGRLTGNAATTMNSSFNGISTTSATLGTGAGRVSYADFYGVAIFATMPAVSNNVGPSRLSLSGTTTVYFVAQAAFGVNTCSAYGSIMARRRR